MAANLDLLEPAHLSRKEKRKQSKKMRRKLIRQRVAEEEKLKKSVGLDDAAEQLRIQLEERIEHERLAKEKAEHDEQERHWLEREKKAMEDFQLQQEEIRKLEDARKPEDAEEDLEYVDDDGPAEIIWKGNEIIVRKRRVKVLPDSPAPRALQETSNPLPPQSAAFASHNKYVQTPSVSEQTPAFGTEQDKTHCPFHIKTGVCRFGVRCSRVHVYPEQSFTLLMRNMYTGPGLAWENDEGLEILGTAGTNFRHSRQYMQGSLLDAVIVEIFRPLCFSPATGSFFGCLFTTILNKALKEDGRKRFRWLDEGNRATCHSDEEVAQHYEEFYEDVHSEFLQFGELVNFKVCNNASSHLRGNLYVHYKAEAGAQAAYSALNGRFYAGKQITCEFVGVTRWRVALCGEYMKGRYRLCSHGSACNFLHCFRNPSGEYDWADWDSPPPRSWVAKMAKLFGYEFDREQEHDHESHDDVRRRRRSPGSPPQRAYRHSERRSRDRRRHSNLDDCEKVDRLRDHRWEESGSTHYRSGSEDPRRGHRSHRYRDGHKPSYSKELDERGSGHDWASNHGRHPAESEPPNGDDSELTGDAGEQEQQRRHKIDKVDIQKDEIDQSVYEKGGVSSRDRSRSSNRLVQDADDDSKYKRHRSRGHGDSDRRQSLDLRSSSKYRSRTSEIGSPADQGKLTAKDVPLREKYHKERVETRTHNDKSGKSVDNSGSSDKSDIDHGCKRHRGHSSRYSEGRRSRRKSMTHEDEIESEKSPNVDDRWTGVKES